mmetsp:Transcript_7658/g.19693  ORF Transcript_7658/g.19693 Transcript_7658/m.19693 type:complete len:210 (+) Transcript_7658:323-952(+)
MQRLAAASLWQRASPASVGCPGRRLEGGLWTERHARIEEQGSHRCRRHVDERATRSRHSEAIFVNALLLRHRWEPQEIGHGLAPHAALDFEHHALGRQGALRSNTYLAFVFQNRLQHLHAHCRRDLVDPDIQLMSLLTARWHVQIAKVCPADGVAPMLQCQGTGQKLCRDVIRVGDRDRGTDAQRHQRVGTSDHGVCPNQQFQEAIDPR